MLDQLLSKLAPGVHKPWGSVRGQHEEQSMAQ